MQLAKVDVAVVGGGPGGLAAAKSILTARPDLRVAVFERSTNLRAPRGASLLLLPNGFKALQAIDPALRESVLAIDSKFAMARFCAPDGTVLSEASGEGIGQETRAYGDIAHVAWHDLRMALADSLPGGVIREGMAFESYQEEEEEKGGEGAVTVHFRSKQGEVQAVSAGVLIGADGNTSAVRQQLLGDGAPAFLDTALWRAVLPACPPCWRPVQPSLVWWVGGPQAFGVMSLPGGRLAALARAPWAPEDLGALADATYIQDPEGRLEQMQAAKRRLAAAFEAGWAPEVAQLIDSIDPAYLTEHGQFYRQPEECGVWGRGRVSLLGDAAHLSTPFLGQGTSQAFEDALELGRCIHELGATPEALREYEAVRQPLAGEVHETSVSFSVAARAGQRAGMDEQRVNIERGFVKRTFEPLPRAVAA